jgi:PAS domain S-box-containing protein
MKDDELKILRDRLLESRSRLDIFDGGVFVVSVHGEVIAAEPQRPDLMGQSWLDRPYFREMLRTQNSIFSDIVSDGPQGTEIVVLAVPITGGQGQLLGIIAGMFRVEATFSPLYKDFLSLHEGAEDIVYLIDSTGKVIYHADTNLLRDDFSGQEVVERVLEQETGAVRTRSHNGEEIVASFAPVPGTSWGLVREENWSELASAVSGYSVFLPFLLFLGVVVPVLVVAVGVRRITKPITELNEAARQVAEGDFGQTVSVGTGDEIEDLAEQFNLMSIQLKDTYARLEKRLVEREKAEDALRRDTEQLETLRQASLQLASKRSLKPVLDTVLEYVMNLIPADTAHIFLYDGEHLSFGTFHWKGEPRQTPFWEPREDGLTYTVARSGKRIIVPDVKDSSLYQDKKWGGAIVGIPLISSDRVCGVMNIAFDEAHEFIERELRILELFADQAAASIENAQLQEQVQRHTEDLAARVAAATVELRESEEKYRRLVESTTDWVWTIDSEWRNTYSNRAIKHLLGYEVSEIEGMTASQLVHPDDLNLMQERDLASFMEKRGWVGVPIRWIHKDGSVRYFESTAQPILDGAGNFMGFSGIDRDVTERIKAEEAEKEQRAFAEALADTAAILNSTLDLDEVLDRILANLGRVVPHDTANIMLLDEDKRQAVVKRHKGFEKLGSIEGLMTTPLSIDDVHNLRFMIENFQPFVVPDVREDTDWVKIEGLEWIRSNAGAPITFGSMVLGFLSVNSTTPDFYTDTHAERLQSFANQASVAIQNASLYEAAQEADRIKSAFLASMSHELRTPLNSIIGFTGILLQGLVGPLNEEQTKQLSMVRVSARHLLALINDVLDISKIEAGQLKVDSEPFDMREAIEKAIQTSTPQAENKGLALVAEVTPEVGEVIGDGRRVEQILINLINNAVKFTEVGEVRVECQTKDGWLETRVIDTGIGIKTEDVDKLFRPFRQIDSGLSRKHEGTGLGLSICKRLVEMLGGEIWVESEWEVGSTFGFVLPVKQDE